MVDNFESQSRGQAQSLDLDLLAEADNADLREDAESNNLIATFAWLRAASERTVAGAMQSAALPR